MNSKKISIITVCYNAEECIEKTIKSVIDQDYVNLEYIIVDGLSNDKTIDIINEYKKQQNIRIKMISERDKGIYDAMNKGIKISTGEIIFFLNAGDIFYDDKVLKKIESKFTSSDIVYGDVKIDNYIVNQKHKINNMFFIREGMICHQSIFANRKCFEDNLFDTHYKVCADRKWLIRNFKIGREFTYIPEIISVYDNNGFSTTELAKNKIKKESIEIIVDNFGEFYKYLVYSKRLLGKIKKYIIHLINKK